MPRLNNLGVLSVLLLLFLCRPSASASFFRGENALNRPAAASYCATKGSSLASIINQADFDAATTACSSNSCWIGLQESQENAWGWEWDNAAPVTNFGFEYELDTTSPPPTAGVSPWAAGQPFMDGRSNLCVTLDGGFRSSDCGLEAVHYPLCSRAKWAVLLEHKSLTGGYFSSEFLSTGIENEYDPTANAFSIIGRQGDGEHFRNDGLFYFKLDWTMAAGDLGDESTNPERRGAPVFWSQSTWLSQPDSDVSSTGATRYAPEYAQGAGGWVRGFNSGPSELYAYLADDSQNMIGVTRDDGRAETPGVPTVRRSNIRELNEYADSQTLSVYMDGDGSSDVAAIAVTACDGWRHFGTGMLSIMVRGTDGSSPFIPVNPFSTDMPQNGQTAIFDVDADLLNVGTVMGVSLDVNDENGICIQELRIISSSATCTPFPSPPTLSPSQQPTLPTTAPIAGHIACGETTSFSFISGDSNAKFVQFVVTEPRTVTFSNCATVFDTKLKVWTQDLNAEVSLPYCDGGDDCGDCGGNGEEFVIPDMAANTYVLEIAPYNSNSDGEYIIDVQCAPSPTLSQSKQPIQACSFGASYFGRGIMLKSREKCATSFVDVLGDGQPMLPCYDDGFLDLSTVVTRGVVDLSIHSCDLVNGGMSAPSDGDLPVHVVLTGKSSVGSTFISSNAVPLTFSDEWAANSYRHFEINVDVPIAKLTLVQLYGGSEPLCVDAMTANELSALYFSENWIGGDHAYLTAVFKYPVCATEVTGMRVVADSSTSKLIDADSIITGLECSNYNRILSSTCSISQSYETSKTTSFTMAEESSTESSTESSMSSAYSWGTESSTSTSKELSFGSSQSLTVGAEVSGGIGPVDVSASVEVSVEQNQQFTRTSESTSGRNQEQSTGSESSTGSSTGSSASSENSWESTVTASISCEASMDVAPSHSVSYSLIFNAFNATMRTLTDMKLTLCSAMFRAEGEESNDDYIFIDNIEGTLTHRETTACEVQFGPAEYLRNKVKCAEEEKLAIAAGATYIPRCVTGDGAKYEACQCDIGDSNTMGVCWCSDETGNPTDTNVRQFGEPMTDTEVCAQLACSLGGHGAAVQGELGDDGELQTETHGELESEALEPSSIDLKSLNNLLSLWPLLDNLLTAALITLVLTSATIAVYVANKCVQWISHGKQSQRTGFAMAKAAPQMKEQELTEISVVEEASQETV